ncbi:MAG: helix-turn-helix transcriptional regulator [Patescibacteria group bacterium]
MNSNKNLNDLGNKFRKARESANLTQAEVAEVVGVTVNYYARLERGEVKPSLDILAKIMKLLKIKTLDVSELS